MNAITTNTATNSRQYVVKFPSFLAAAGLILGLFIIPYTGVAETIIVPIGQQGQARGEVKRPASGMLQSQVESQFGKPLSSTGPVGTPPISSWTYQDFVVYFEYDHVVHSVLKPTPTDTAMNQTTTDQAATDAAAK